MGKGGKAQTVGYKYYLGMHLGLCHGPIDEISRLQVDGRDAWTGSNAGGTIYVAADELFGGEKREGGVSGNIDVAMGGPAQGKNSYLMSQLGALIPAYRGIVGLIFRQCYLGNNPYLKAWSARGTRIHVRQNGIPQWYDAAAEISLSSSPPYDLSAAFPVLEQGDAGYPAVGQFYPRTIVIGPYATGASVVAGNPDGSGSCRPDDFFYFNGLQVGNVAATVYAGGTILYELQPGETLEIKVKNTLNSYSGLSGSLHVRFPSARRDMNAAHIIRECLTDPDWGMGYTDADIEDDTFIAAADTFKGEGLGISLLWDKQIPIEDFVNIVQRHVDCALFVSRKTGKYVIKPIRGGYNEAALVHLNESNIIDVSDPVRVAEGEQTNSVTVTYWDADTGKDGSVTVTDTALVQRQGVVINTPLQYPGFSNPRNATIAAQRDLRALSAPLLSCTITADSTARDLEIGDVFAFSWAKWGLDRVVMRINGIAYGTGRNNRVKINCTMDVFDTDTNVSIVVPDPGWTDPSAPPSAVPYQLAVEAPYYELVQFLGQSSVDSKLATTTEIGYLIAAGARPSSAINASLYTDNGTGFEDVGALDFAPSAKLFEDIDKRATSFLITEPNDLSQVAMGTHFQVGDELMRVDSLDLETGEVTVGRGVLDTVPQDHAAGDVLLFWDQDAGFDPTEYVEGEEVEAKIIPVSGAGVLPMDEAVTMAVTMASRAFRPYPPGDLRLNAASYEPDAFYDGDVSVSWTHRDRLQQTSGVLIDASAGNIGPEAGTLYRVRVYVEDVLVTTADDIADTQFVWAPNETGRVRIEVHSKRDGIYSLFAPSHTFLNSEARLTEEGDTMVTEDAGERVVED